MQVKAKGDGYYGGLRKAGDVFEVAPGAKGSWFDPVDSHDSIVPRAPKVKKESKVDAPAAEPAADLT